MAFVRFGRVSLTLVYMRTAPQYILRGLSSQALHRDQNRSNKKGVQELINAFKTFAKEFDKERSSNSSTEAKVVATDREMDEIEDRLMRIWNGMSNEEKQVYQDKYEQQLVKQRQKVMARLGYEWLDAGAFDVHRKAAWIDKTVTAMENEWNRFEMLETTEQEYEKWSEIQDKWRQWTKPEFFLRMRDSRYDHVRAIVRKNGAIFRTYYHLDDERRQQFDELYDEHCARLRSGFEHDMKEAGLQDLLKPSNR
eukprot:TRINITY_DN6418_c0_g1_i1.p1 TRINITY_DN6418_c0_g1~~TRINITY_DN6418_c0_g1_i1.p1  ORF type:complete len:283 (+),score=45.16 TRINITY_DN6418_c0_g1_i1:95-850(+)